MKKILFSFIVLFLGAVSCQKEQGTQDNEIVLHIDTGELSSEVTTKTPGTVYDSTPPSALYWGGTYSDFSHKWGSSYKYLSSNNIYTGAFQTASPTSYMYYVSNVNMSIGSDTVVYASNSTDVVVGMSYPTSSTNPSITMYHVFARTGTISTSTAAGSVTVHNYYIVGYSGSYGTSGIYSITRETWSGCSGLTSDTSISSGGDMWLIPGTYTIKVDATYTRGDYSVRTTKSGTITLTANKINNISITWPTAGTEIVVGVSLTGWSYNSVATNVS